MHPQSPLSPGRYFGISSSENHTNGCIFQNRSYSSESTLPWHSHEAPFFCLLLSGTYSETYGSRNWEYEPGSVVFHPAGEEHRTWMGAKGGDVFLIEIGDSLRNEMNRLPFPWHTRCERVGTPVSWLTNQVHRELNLSPNGSLLMESLVMELLDRTNEMEKIRFAPPWLCGVMQRIREDHHSSFTIQNLASEFNVHPFHLARVFKHFNGTSIGEYIQKLRIDSAIRLMHGNRRMKLCDIAIQLGFADQSHFNRTFKKWIGVSPAFYVKEIR